MMIFDFFIYHWSGYVSNKIGYEINEKHSSKVIIGELTDFQWDELFIFSPYSTRERICPTLGVSGIKCW
jgi:hypothetical protein